MSNALRKNITIDPEDYQAILDFSRKTGKTVSEVLRTGTLYYIKQMEKADLAEFLQRNTQAAGVEEQRGFEKFIASYVEIPDDPGEEVDIHEFIQTGL